ncbi:MAG: CBS domain-containing protein [Anaerolineae bacterium]|nr:CBS domain-containing protein [Anaerolineae bacterium]
MAGNSKATPATADRHETLADLFHLVGKLIPEGQQVVSVHPDTSVAEALALMEKHNFSQLPVSVNSRVVGVFSHHSLAVGLLRMGKVDEPIGDLPTEEFVEQLQFVQADENWEAIVPHLNEDEAVLVGTRRGLDAILTPMDGLTYLAQVTAPFVLLAEIEQALRQIISACIPAAELPACIQNALAKKYSSAETPHELMELTVDDYVLLIQHGQNWPRFASVFGNTPYHRSRVGQRLREIRDLRNAVFHFRRKPTPEDEDTLRRHRDWLQIKTQLLAKPSSDDPALAFTAPAPEDFQRLLTRIPVPEGQRQLYKALYDAGAAGLTHAELIAVMGRRDMQDLAGVLGALGHRVNGTPGYGEENQPGTNMVIDWESLPEGKWRLRLKPEMCAALEALQPAWLFGREA